MIKELKIKNIEERINSANIAYRSGNSIISDKEYDTLLDQLKVLDPENSILKKIGIDITDESRKVDLPIPMHSMDKCKTHDEIINWCRIKGISQNEIVIITPKFDGLSFLVDEETNKAYTRGNGYVGQKSDDHYSFIKNHLWDIDDEFDEFSSLQFKYTYGEVMMPKKIFTDKYSNIFANPRNLVAGLLNSKTIDESLMCSLKDCNYIKYGAICQNETNSKSSIFSTKKEILDELNRGQKEKVNYHICKLKDITEDLLIDLFYKLSPNYEIDGIVIEINDLKLQEMLGRETSSGNPVWNRAFKHSSFEQSAETIVIGISWNVSKQGLLKPIVHVNPVRLDGVNVSNVTANNARFVKDMGIGVGAKIRIVRSGMVIPKIVDIIEPVEFVMPDVPNIGWNDNGVELVTLEETDEQKIKQAISFLEILGVERVGEGVVRQLWDAGFNSIKAILEATPDQLYKLDGFGKRKAAIVTNAIQDKIKDVPLSKLQHATGLFGNGLGSKKLALLEHFTEKPSIDQVMALEGFADISAKNYIDNYDRFFEFAKDLPVVVSSKKEETTPVGYDLVGQSFVFTGVRRSDLEGNIESRGGKIGNSVSKNTTYLVMKSVGSGSSKETKAIGLGVKIITVDQLEGLLNG